MRNRVFMSLVLFAFSAAVVVILGLVLINVSGDDPAGDTEIVASAEITCQLNLKQIELAICEYYMEYGRHPESIEDLSGYSGSDSWENNRYGCEYSLEFKEEKPTPVCSKGHRLREQTVERYDVE